MYYRLVSKISDYFAPINKEEWHLAYSESLKIYWASRVERSYLYLALGILIAFLCGPLIGLSISIAYYYARIKLEQAVLNSEKLYQDENFDKEGIEKSVLERISFISLITLFAIIFLGTKHENQTACIFAICAIFAMIIRNQSAAPSILVAGIIWPSIGVAIVAFEGILIHNEFSSLVGALFFIGVGAILTISIMRERVASFRNYSELRIKAEQTESLLEQMQRTHKMRETLERVAGIGFFEWHYASDDITWSEGAYRAFGVDDTNYKPSAKDFFPRVLKEDAGKLVEQMRLAKSSKEVTESNFRIRRLDGNINYLACYGMPIMDSKGNPVGMEGLVIDETQPNTALAKETEITKLLNTALESSKSFVTLRYMSQKKFKFFGSGAVYGDNPGFDLKNYDEEVRQFYTPEDYVKMYEATLVAQSTGQPQSFEHAVRRPDGTNIHARSFVYVIGAEETNDLKIVVMTTDITEGVERQIELADALEKAQLSNKAKSEFLANMSHEIRTPLNGVVAVAGLLARTELDQKQGEMVKIIETSGQNLGHILNDVLDLARVESGKIEIEKIAFLLKETVLAATSLFAVKADEKGLDFKVEMSELADNYFLGDPVRLRQIISNFLSNAIKFTSRGGVSLEVLLKKSKENDCGYVCTIAIKDTGSGIREDALGRMFSRFEQADGSITKTHGGTGLGLAISKALADLMGGRIYAESVEGHGSIFYLELPLEQTDHVAPIEPEEVQADMQGEPTSNVRVLLVEDNPTNRRIVDLILTQLGVKITMAENGLEAVEAFKKQKFDLILMDLQMPVMDGLTATKIIRGIELSEDREITPIIALSANAMSHHIAEARDAGACLHVAKPFTPQKLIETLELALDSESICRERALREMEANSGFPSALAS